MIISKEKRKEFNSVVMPVMKWLEDNLHPNTSIIIDSISAELFESVSRLTNEEPLITQDGILDW